MKFKLILVGIILVSISFQINTIINKPPKPYSLKFDEFKELDTQKLIYNKKSLTTKQLKESKLTKKEIEPFFVLKDYFNNREVRGYLNLIQKPDQKFKEFKSEVKNKYDITDIKEDQFNKGYYPYPFKMIIDTSLLTEKNKVFLGKKVKESGNIPKNYNTYIYYFILASIYFFLFYKLGIITFAKPAKHTKSKVKFEDVAGIDDATEELTEVIDFLKHPKKYKEIGASIPKGLLLTGAPGTGKTLLAKAVAGEAKVPVYTATGSDFIEKYVGTGATRIRKLFKDCKKNSPCVLFIDEIDSLGGKRNKNSEDASSRESTQTLNTLLVQMDGFNEDTGIIVIGATNRMQTMDEALLRPGRFDRIVHVTLPDLHGREEILKVHTKNMKIKKDVSLKNIAKQTTGFSGAELANLINEAAILTVKKGLKHITQIELKEAKDKIKWGKQRVSLKLSEKDKKTIAYHEAGHAICNLLCEHTDTLEKVTIIPRGNSLGMAMYTPEENKVNHRKKELLDHICVAMGGRAAEALMINDITSGASGDIEQATDIATQMVCKLGMSKLGMIEFNTKKHQYSNKITENIDNEIKSLIKTEYDRAFNLLTKHKDKLEAVAQALLKEETITGEKISKIVFEKKI